MRLMILLLMIVAVVSGCTRLRFVVDLTTAEDALTESVVLQDDRSRLNDKIAMIDVTGLIVDARRGGVLAQGDNPVADLFEGLRKAGDDARVKAVVLRINSPGGTVTASDVMYREVVRFREQTGKPVVVLMGDVAASGGFYLACAADHVVAHPTSITGSIGVIIQTFNVSEGMRRIGIRAEAITSGENKAAGSPFEPMQPGHRAILQGLVDEFYEGFVSIVTDRRPALAGDTLMQVTDGRVVTGKRAMDVGLIDQLGDIHYAYEAAKKLAGIERARLVKYHRPLNHVASPYAAASVPTTATQVNLFQLNLDTGGLLDQPGVYYLWDPVAFDTP
jgi:protease-4